MSDAVGEAYGLGSLRQRAGDKLGASTPSAVKRASQIDAMAVLYQLALSPATAADAQAMLHELQVNQVEVDLLHEELGRAHSELETTLRRQAHLVERAPVGYMTIDAQSVLYEINLAAALLLGATGRQLLGRPLAPFLMPRSADALQALLTRTREGQVAESCELELMPIAGIKRTVLAAAENDNTPDRFLLVLMSSASTHVGLRSNAARNVT